MPDKNQMPGKLHILITGATDGIGLALARHYQQMGARPLLLGRKSWAELPQLAAHFNPADYCQADLSQPDCVARVETFLQQRGLDRLDVVIHNAGVGYHGPLAAQTPASIDQLIDVNLVAPVALTQALLPWLPAGRGRVLFIGSVVADLPGPEYAVYTATKAALTGLARNLRLEWQGQVQVQLIHPGATRTGMHAKMGISPEKMNWQAFPPAERVAAQIATAVGSDGARGRRPFHTIGRGNQLAGWAGRQLDSLIDPLLRRRFAAPPLAAGTQPPSCVITGAADGIGRALAGRFLQAGYRVVGIDVDAAQAQRTQAELAGSGAPLSFVIADLTTRDGVATAVAALAAGPPVDVLIHNAGISAAGPFAALSMRRQRQVIDLNLRAPLQLTAALLSQEKLAAGGSVVFLSSLSKFVGYPGAAVYAATKDGLAAYGRSLRVALGPTANVLTVFPGPTRTAHARRYSPDNSREGRRMSPEILAEGVFQAVQRRRRLFIPGVGNRLFAALGKVAPRLMEQAMKRAIFVPLAGRTLE